MNVTRFGPSKRMDTDGRDRESDVVRLINRRTLEFRLDRPEAPSSASGVALQQQQQNQFDADGRGWKTYTLLCQTRFDDGEMCEKYSSL